MQERPNSHFSSPTSCFVPGPEAPASTGVGASPGVRGGHSYPEHPHVCGTGLLPETRSTPFCNHTLHFGGLTMKNTKRIRIIGGGGGNGTAERRRHAISDGRAHIRARTAGIKRSMDAKSPRSHPRTTAADRQNPTNLGTIVAKRAQAKHLERIQKGRKM